MAEYKEERLNNTREYKYKTKLNTCKDLIKFGASLTNFRDPNIDNIINYSTEILKEYIVIIYDNGAETKKRLERAKHIINNNLLTISVLLEILFENLKIQQKQIKEFERYYEVLRITS